ncbi:MAG: Coq4 family protein [Candidatus Sericytochromatia bacterium]
MNEYQLLKQVYFKPQSGFNPDSSNQAQIESLGPRLRQLRRAGVLGADVVWMLLRFSKLLINKDDISPIFQGRSFTRHKSFAVSLQTFREDPDTAALLDERYLSERPYDLEALRQLPAGTLGHEFAGHMLAYKLEIVFYPPLEQTENGDIAYLRKRARQTHDIHHVVLGFPAIDSGEMAISAFYLAQHNVPLSALLIGFGFLYAILREPERIEELMNAIQLGWQIGKRARKLMGVRWEDYWETPIDDVRRLLGVPIPLGTFPAGRASQ